MKKTAIFTDLDNTIMYSHKRIYETDICIEKYNGKEFSFTPKTVYESLCNLSFESNVDVVPVTTRSLQQFKRIRLPSAIKKAYVNNGGLLVEGDVTTDVYSRLTDDQIKTIVWFYKTVCQLTNVKTIDNMFIYAVCDTPEIANAVVQARMELGTQLGNLKAVAAGRKTYIMAPGMTKAIAVNKMKDSYDVLIAAGDSELDIPMLLQCDHAIVPNEEMRSRLMYEATNGIWNGTPYRVKNIHCYQGGSMTFPEYVIHETRDIAYSED